MNFSFNLNNKYYETKITFLNIGDGIVVAVL